MHQLKNIYTASLEAFKALGRKDIYGCYLWWWKLSLFIFIHNRVYFYHIPFFKFKFPG